MYNLVLQFPQIYVLSDCHILTIGFHAGVEVNNIAVKEENIIANYVSVTYRNTSC